MVSKELLKIVVTRLCLEPILLSLFSKSIVFLQNLRIWLGYDEYAAGLEPKIISPDLSSNALKTACEIRANHKPAFILHGVMQRSGTGFVGGSRTLLGLHPDISPHPNELWEIPFLEHTNHLKNFQKRFLDAYPRNLGKIGHNDFMPLFGSAFIAYLYSFVESGKHISITRPSVINLYDFFTFFPNEYLLLLMRDGRDVVHSYLHSSPKSSFPNLCKRWNDNAKLMIEFIKSHEKMSDQFLYVRFEDVVADPDGFIKKFCDHFGLDSKYPYEKIKDIPVVGSSTMKKEGKVTWDPVKKPKGFKPVGRWVDWTDKKKKLFKDIAGKTLIDAGYCVDLKW